MVRNKLKNKKGLTLIELLAVIVILGIIAAIATPAIMDAVNDSKAKSFSEELNSIQTLANNYELRTTLIDYSQFSSGPDYLKNVKGAFAAKNIKKANWASNQVSGSHYLDASLTVNTSTGEATAGTIGGKTIAVSLAKQLGKVYATGSQSTVTFKVYPIDIELLYDSGMLSQDLRYPTVKHTYGYGPKFQNKLMNGGGASPSLTSATLTFPSNAAVAGGHFFITDNGRVFYTGTDAIYNDGDNFVHMAGSSSK